MVQLINRALPGQCRDGMLMLSACHSKSMLPSAVPGHPGLCQVAILEADPVSLHSGQGHQGLSHRALPLPQAHHVQPLPSLHALLLTKPLHAQQRQMSNYIYACVSKWA